MTNLSRALLLAAAALLLAAQTGRQIPPCQGEECRGDSGGSHEGQPRFCQNHDGGGYQHNCDCQKHACERDGAPGGGDMPQCTVYCRKSSCRCQKPCQTE